MIQARAMAVFLLLGCAVLLGGCISTYGPLQIQSLKQKNVTLTPKVTESYYCFDRDQNLTIILHGVASDLAGRPIEQIVTFRIFWRPSTSLLAFTERTSFNTTSINATYRYAVITPDAVGLYEGAGFVRLWGRLGDATIRGAVLDGDLHLTQASGVFTDTLGRGRMHGDFAAAFDDVKATDLLLATQQEFFARSLATVPTGTATAPATAPGVP